MAAEVNDAVVGDFPNYEVRLLADVVWKDYCPEELGGQPPLTTAPPQPNRQ
jgi:hypothetical protein